MKKVTIGRGEYPANLEELLKSDKEQANYLLKNVYSLQMWHGIDKSAPAVFATEENRLVISDDLELITEIWKQLPPYHSKILKTKYYVHKHGWVGYKINQDGGDRNSLPENFITREELIISKISDFKWQLADSIPPIEEKDFLNNIEASIASIKKSAA